MVFNNGLTHLGLEASIWVFNFIIIEKTFFKFYFFRRKKVYQWRQWSYLIFLPYLTYLFWISLLFYRIILYQKKYIKGSHSRTSKKFCLYLEPYKAKQYNYNPIKKRLPCILRKRMWKDDKYSRICVEYTDHDNQNFWQDANNDWLIKFHRN